MDEAFKAIFDNRTQTLRDLLGAGLDVTSTARYGNTLIGTAAESGHAGPIHALLEHGADPNQRSYYRSPVDKRYDAAFTPLMYAKNSEVAQVLIAARADVNARSDTGSTPLMRACRGDDPALLELLIDAGAEVNAVNDAGTTPLMFASQWGRDEFVRCLIRHGADVNLRQHRRRGRKAWTALGLARDGLAMWESFSPEQLKPSALAIIEAHRNTVRILESAGAAA